jgi:hypothetical protein
MQKEFTNDDVLDAIDLGDEILKNWHEQGIDPIMAYGALVGASLQLHKMLGYTKKDWILSMIEIAELSIWEENEDHTN